MRITYSNTTTSLGVAEQLYTAGGTQSINSHHDEDVYFDGFTWLSLDQELDKDEEELRIIPQYDFKRRISSLSHGQHIVLTDDETILMSMPMTGTLLGVSMGELPIYSLSI